MTYETSETEISNTIIEKMVSPCKMEITITEPVAFENIQSTIIKLGAILAFALTTTITVIVAWNELSEQRVERQVKESLEQVKLWDEGKYPIYSESDEAYSDSAEYRVLGLELS